MNKLTNSLQQSSKQINVLPTYICIQFSVTSAGTAHICQSLTSLYKPEKVNEAQLMRTSTSSAGTYALEHTSCNPGHGYKIQKYYPFHKTEDKINQYNTGNSGSKVIYTKEDYRVNRNMFILNTKLEQGCLFQWQEKKAWKHSGSQFLLWPRIITKKKLDCFIWNFFWTAQLPTRILVLLQFCCSSIITCS